MATKQQMDACCKIMQVLNEVNSQAGANVFFCASFEGSVDSFSVYGYHRTEGSDFEYVESWSACQNIVYLGDWYRNHYYDDGMALALLEDIHSKLQVFIIADADGVPL